MTISAKIIADSISPQGKRITTLQLRYPKFVHGELMTHRVFSRNASSSRAIPVERMIADVMDDPAVPVHWGKNQKGMQAEEEMSEAHIKLLRRKWLNARDEAVANAQTLMQDGLHKQIANRVMEPFLNINTLVTATEYDNFFELRCHKDAQPEIRVLAEAMRDARHESEPVLRRPGEWHLPYVKAQERRDYDDETCLKLSVARCARVSYLTQDGQQPSVEADHALYDRLIGSIPLHASPAEHQAMPDNWGYNFPLNPKVACFLNGKQHGNFVGWRQYRRTLEGGIV